MDHKYTQLYKEGESCPYVLVKWRRMHALLEKSIENSINVIFQGFNEVSFTVQ